MKVASVATLGVTMWRSGQDVPGRLPRVGLEVALCIVGDLNKCSGTAGWLHKAVLYFLTSIRFKTITRIGKREKEVYRLCFDGKGCQASHYGTLCVTSDL